MTHSTLILARDALLGWMDQPDTPAAYDASMQRAVTALAAIEAELAASADAGRLASDLLAAEAKLRSLGYREEANSVWRAWQPVSENAARWLWWQPWIERRVGDLAPYEAQRLAAAAEPVSAQGDERAALRDALKPFLTALEVNDSDTLSSMDSDETVLFTMTGSWSHPAPVTLGDLRKLAGAARAQAAQGDEVNARWQPIETAPRDGLPFLGCTDAGLVQIIKRNKHLWIWIDMDGRESYRSMTLWMPLPAPPAARAQQGSQE